MHGRAEPNHQVSEAILPPTPKGKQYELKALGLRELAGVRRDDEPLDPYELARCARLMVVDFERIHGLPRATRRHLLGAGSDDWSGGACSRPLPNGWRLVILNPKHGPQRNNATLMEEVCHILLGHRANRLAVVAKDEQGKVIARDYNNADEEAAFAVGAAALVPFNVLRRLVLAGKTAEVIARRFNVSRQLVEYRIKVSRLWPEYKARHPRAAGQRSRRDSNLKSASSR